MPTPTESADGFSLNPGVWGLAADADADACFDFTKFLSGDCSVRFKDTTPAADPRYWEKLAPCAPGAVIRGDWIVGVDSVAAGDEVALGILWLDSDYGYLSISTIFSGVMPGVMAGDHDFYQVSGSVTAPAGACFRGAMFLKKKTAFNAYLDKMGSVEIPAGFAAYRSTTQSCTTGTTVIFATESYDNGGCYDNSTGVFTALRDGRYSFNANIRLKNMVVGEYVQAILRAGGVDYYGSLTYAALNGYSFFSHVGHNGLWLNRGETAEIVVTHNHGSAMAVEAAVGMQVYFSGVALD